MDQPQPDIIPSQKNNKERMWAALCHGSALAAFFLFFLKIMVPFGNILGPLVVWLVKKEGMPLVDKNGKEALNFQISVSLYLAAALLLTAIQIGYFILPVIVFGGFFLTVLATIKTANNEDYRYPLTLRFIK